MAKKKSRKERDVVKRSGEMPAVTREHETGAGEASEASASVAASAVTSGVALGTETAAPDKGKAPPVEKDKRQQLYADVRAQREARRGRVRSVSAAEDAPAGYVRRSSLYLATGLALVAGLFVGSLLPGLAGHNLSGSASVSAPAATAGDQGNGQASPSASKEDAATRLAGHILELEDAVRKNPEDVAAWVQLGNLYFDSGKAPQAINAYERALLLKPDDANVLTDLGVMYREAGKYELAVQSFRNASKVDPRHQNALFNRGVVLFFDLKRKEEGRKVWQELLVLNPQAKAPDGRQLKDMLRDLK